jgi:hypothetical protein
METHILRAPRFIDPQWLNRVRHGEHAAVIGEDGTVFLDNVELQFSDSGLPAGTAVTVWLNASGFFVCASCDALADKRRNDESRTRAEREERARALNLLRSDAVAFNARLALPVRWDVGIKVVVSGLSETSMGDGRNKSTVEHIYLLEPVSVGRIKRDAGDFLCTSASGSNGKRWSTVIERRADGSGSEYVPKVTCKACLAIASRWVLER